MPRIDAALPSTPFRYLKASVARQVQVSAAHHGAYRLSMWGITHYRPPPTHLCSGLRTSGGYVGMHARAKFWSLTTIHRCRALLWLWATPTRGGTHMRTQQHKGIDASHTPARHSCGLHLPQPHAHTQDTHTPTRHTHTAHPHSHPTTHVRDDMTHLAAL